MLKFKVTGERFAEACNIIEYLNLVGGDRDTGIRIMPRFLLNGGDEYMVKVNLDDDGDITSYENVREALTKMSAVTPKRLEKLVDEVMEAAKAIVNPPKEGG